LLHNFSDNTNKTDPGAVELVEELDGLPLALSTAGAYLENVSMTLSDYLRHYKTSWLQLQTASPQLESYIDRPLYTTWQITFDRIQQQNPASASLLKLWAYFDRQDVWFGLLQHANSTDDHWIQELTKTELNFNEAAALLCSFGLVDPDRALPQDFGSRGYSVHSCVHSWMVFVLNKEWDNVLARLALRCVAATIPMRNEKESWILQRRLLQHAIRQQEFILEGKGDPKGVEWALNKLGILWCDQGKLAEAEAIYTRALQGYEKAFGPKHISTLGTYNSLGVLYFKQGKLVEAETMYTRALQGREEILGPNHILTLETVNSLGILWCNQGKLKEAETMYTRVLQGYEEAFGPKHISTLGTYNSLGVLYFKQGKLVEAEMMHTRALQGREEILGPNHILTLEMVNSLSILYANQGKLKEAEAMLTRALQGNEEALGLIHISTLYIVNNLGIIYAKQGKLVKAEAMLTRAIQGYEEALGLEHISTLDVVNNLASLYAAQGKLAEAEVMFTRALQGYEEALGPQLVQSYLPALTTIFWFGDLLSRTDRKDKAKGMYARALSGYTIVQGPSSKYCKQLEYRLQALEVTSTKLKTGPDEFTETEAATSSSFERKLRRVGRRLNIR